jgi:hypothetical protein
MIPSVILNVNYCPWVLLAGVAGFFFSAPLALSSETILPLESAANWSFGDDKPWKWEGTGEAPILRLTKQSDFKPKVRSPFNLAWFERKEWGSFALTAEVRLDLFNQGNNDVCIAFGKETETRFYYAHLGENADKVHLHLHLVHDANRTPITEKRAKTLPWQEKKWHSVKLERSVEDGTIRVWFDGVEVLCHRQDLGKRADRTGIV